MRVLIADDDECVRMILGDLLTGWGYTVESVTNGTDALTRLTSKNPPSIALLDWRMPGIDGTEICRRIEAVRGNPFIYLLLISGMSDRSDVINGLNAGADDYVTKPFDPAELRSRLRAGSRLVELQHRLEEAAGRIRSLHGLLPICARCKKIRDNEDYWHEVEEYIRQHAEVQFSHGLCPECFQTLSCSLASADPIDLQTPVSS